MILVDSSVLIDYVEGHNTPAARRFGEVLDRGIPFGISPITLAEVLQGAATERDFDLLSEYLGTQTLYTLSPGSESYAAAAKISFKLRKAGLSGPGTVDCLIAQTAIEQGLFLLHADADFGRIAKVTPLKMW